MINELSKTGIQSVWQELETARQALAPLADDPSMPRAVLRKASATISDVQRYLVAVVLPQSDRLRAMEQERREQLAQAHTLLSAEFTEVSARYRTLRDLLHSLAVADDAQGRCQ